MYKLIQSVVTKEINMVLHIERNTFIPFDIGNTTKKGLGILRNPE